MSGSRQLFGIDFPTTNMLGSDVVAILSVQPASVSPDGTEALLAVRVRLSDNNQIDRHIFLDLTSGSYGNVGRYRGKCPTWYDSSGYSNGRGYQVYVDPY